MRGLLNVGWLYYRRACAAASDRHLAAARYLRADLAAACVLAPALVAVYRMRRDAHALAGIAIGTQLLVLANAALWFAYAGVLGSFWVGAPGLINAPLSAVIIALVLRTRVATRQSDGTCLQEPVVVTSDIPSVGEKRTAPRGA